MSSLVRRIQKRMSPSHPVSTLRKLSPAEMAMIPDESFDLCGNGSAGTRTVYQIGGDA